MKYVRFCANLEKILTNFYSSVSNLLSDFLEREFLLKVLRKACSIQILRKNAKFIVWSR